MKAKEMAKLIKVRSNTLSKVFAVIAYIQLENRVDWESIQSAVKVGAPIPTIEIMLYKESKYNCIKCGASVDEPYMVKRHPCGWGKKRRRI